MNRDQVKGRMKEAAGKIQQKAGKATGSISQQAKGLAKQGVAKVQKNVGDARNVAERSEKDRYSRSSAVMRRKSHGPASPATCRPAGSNPKIPVFIPAELAKRSVRS